MNKVNADQLDFKRLAGKITDEVIDSVMHELHDGRKGDRYHELDLISHHVCELERFKKLATTAGIAMCVSGANSIDAVFAAVFIAGFKSAVQIVEREELNRMLGVLESK